MKHNPEIAHDCLHPCMMLEMYERLSGSDNVVMSDQGRIMMLEMIKGMFDITRRDLCFGGYAPWERDPHVV